MSGTRPNAIANRPRLLYLLVSFSFLLLALASKSYTGSCHQFVNHYLGDLFIVGCLYFLLLLCFPNLSPLPLAALVLAVSVSVESAQAHVVPILQRLPHWIRFWTGTTFDPLDILAYCAGIALAASTHLLLKRGAEGRVPAA